MFEWCAGLQSVIVITEVADDDDDGFVVETVQIDS
jgi:hypothetical protein